MAHALYTNNAVATLASGISAGDTSATLTAGQGALFPNPLTGNYFWGTLNDAATGLVIEIVQVTARATDTLTIVRAQQGTSANAYLAGDKFELRVTAQGLQDLQPISELGAAAYDNIVTIANGGTNSSSYTAPAGGISPLVYYDGTKFSTDAIVADAGYNTSTNTINSTNFVASANLSGTSFKLGYQSIATNGGTTTFTVTSPYYTIFTGTQSQTVVLPDATTLSVGWKYGVDNDSTQSITINANGGGAFWIVAPGCDLYITLSSNASAAGTWEKDYNAAKVANGKGVTISNSMTFTGPDGGTNSFNSLTDAGNLTFTGTGNRITGDFSNATVANRVMFQTSTVNGGTAVEAIPNGSAVGAQLIVFNNSNPTNATYAAITVDASTATFNSGITGSGTYLPLTFATGNAERMRIDTSGNINIPTLGARITGDFSNGTIANRVLVQTSTATSPTSFGIAPTSGGGYAETLVFSRSDVANASIAQLMCVDTLDARVSSTKVGTGTYLPLTFYTSGAERVRIDTSGNVSMAGVMYIGYTGGDTPDSYGTSPALQVHTSGADGISNIRWGNDANGASFFFQKSRGAVGTNTLVQSGDSLGTILFAGANGTGFNNAAYIGAYVDATPGASTDMPGRLVFATTADGSATPTNRLKIDNAGNILNISTGGLGYGSGSGTTGSQSTSRTTSVALGAARNAGSITVFTAAPVVGTWFTFGVTGGGWAATDTIEVSVKSATNTYIAAVSLVGAGTCSISMVSIAGTASDGPVVNFAVIKAVTA